MITTGYKVLTHDGRPPIQGGDSLLTGPLPLTLPTRDVDESKAACGAGWNFVADLPSGLRIAGLWPNGRPSRVFIIETDARVIARGDKCRTASLTLVRELSEDEVRDSGIRPLSEGSFGEHADTMIAEQVVWRRALSRPASNPEAVEALLRQALAVRGLDWTLRRFGAARAAWDAWESDISSWDTWAARDWTGAVGARDALNALNALNAWAWNAWAARDARAALAYYYASLRGWVTHEPTRLTTGLRDAYHEGLGLVVPVGDSVLGWTMDEVEP